MTMKFNLKNDQSKSNSFEENFLKKIKSLVKDTLHFELETDYEANKFMGHVKDRYISHIWKKYNTHQLRDEKGIGNSAREMFFWEIEPFISSELGKLKPIEKFKQLRQNISLYWKWRELTPAEEKRLIGISRRHVTPVYKNKIKLKVHEYGQKEVAKALQTFFDEVKIPLDLTHMRSMRLGDTIVKEDHTLKWYNNGYFEIKSKSIDFRRFYRYIENLSKQMERYKKIEFKW